MRIIKTLAKTQYWDAEDPLHHDMFKSDWEMDWTRNFYPRNLLDSGGITVWNWMTYYREEVKSN